MAARTAFGAVCRRLWQGLGNFSVNTSKGNTAKNGGLLLFLFFSPHIAVPI
uniref:Mitochondrial ribosomal protein S10 n=1 Tax=Homo sapiens TaxID=9606 RepID=A0ABB0MVE6_HUMAN